MACAILERMSDLEQSSEMVAPCYISQLLSFNTDHPVVAIDAICHQLGLHSTFYLHVLSKFSATTFSSCSSSGNALMSCVYQSII